MTVGAELGVDERPAPVVGANRLPRMTSPSSSPGAGGGRVISASWNSSSSSTSLSSSSPRGSPPAAAGRRRPTRRCRRRAGRRRRSPRPGSRRARSPGRRRRRTAREAARPRRRRLRPPRLASAGTAGRGTPSVASVTFSAGPARSRRRRHHRWAGPPGQLEPEPPGQGDARCQVGGRVDRGVARPRLDPRVRLDRQGVLDPRARSGTGQHRQARLVGLDRRRPERHHPDGRGPAHADERGDVEPRGHGRRRQRLQLAALGTAHEGVEETLVPLGQVEQRVATARHVPASRNQTQCRAQLHLS